MYDLIIIGGGPAGLTAGIYAARYKLKTLILSEDVGGQLSKAHIVENWPGVRSITGMDLMNNVLEQVQSLGCEFKIEPVKQIEKNNDLINIKTDENEYVSKSLIIACGTVRRKLGIPGEQKLFGRGVSYCATCDGFLYKNKKVLVVGGNDSAAQAAIELAQVAQEVILVYRKDKLRCEPTWNDLIINNPKIKIVYNSNLVEILGDKKVSSVNLDTGSSIQVDGVFIEIGGIPATEIVRQLGVETDEFNSIKVDSSQKTNVSGVFGAGDITNKSPMKQMITASAEGAIAAHSAFFYLREKSKGDLK